MSAELRKTPLHAVHESLGARMVEFGGWDMPVWYTSATEEHHAVRNAAGLFDLSHMAELFVTGPQAAEALDHALLVQASAMPVGRARYTMIVDDNAGIIDDLITYRLGDEEFLVVANASNGPVVAAELTARCAAFSAKVNDRTDDWALVAVQGPHAETIVASIAGEMVRDVKYYRVVEFDLGGVAALAARTGYTGEDGFELFVAANKAAAVWASLTEAGSEYGMVPVGLAARDTLRLEAGMPLYGNELSTDTTPFDVGSARLVKERPAGSIGAEALAAAASSPSKSLIGLHLDGRRPARTGYAVHISADDGASTEIGVVTSGTASPTLDRPIAIARVTQSCAPGDVVHVDVRGTLTPATVIDLPFYRRPEKES